MKYACGHSWKSLPPSHHVQFTISVFQGQGPRPARMWFLHWWDQQMHQRHWAGLPCSCQSESGHQGWHLSWGKADSIGTKRVMLSSLTYPAAFLSVWRFGAECLAQSTTSEERSILTGILLGKIMHWPKYIASGKVLESPGRSRVENGYF